MLFSNFANVKIKHTMARYELKLPKMGESVAEATITSWVKEVGETIDIDDTVARTISGCFNTLEANCLIAAGKVAENNKI